MRDGMPWEDMMPSVAIVGAGISGLACARELTARGIKVKLFDKSRGVGGRVSTRYAGAFEFDHGAQYFTATDPAFEDVVRAASSAGVVAPWTGKALYLSDADVKPDRGKPRHVGTSRMNAFPKLMASGLDIDLGRRVTGLSVTGGWALTFEDDGVEPDFSAVVLTVPPAQALPILPEGFAHTDTIRAAEMDACFALMVGLEGRHDFGITSLRAKGLPVDWIAVNSSKPGRPDEVTTLVIHAEADWSNSHVEADQDHVADVLLQTASDLLFQDLSDAPHKTLHRWLYSSVAHPAGETMLYDPDLRLAVCGDWCAGGRVEGAYLSGLAAAERLAQDLAPR